MLELMIHDTRMVVLKKAIKHVYIRMSLNGKFTVSAPIGADDEWIKSVVMKHGAWIEKKKHQLARYQQQKNLLSNSSAYLYLGQAYMLDYKLAQHQKKIEFIDNKLVIYATQPLNQQQTTSLLACWYREQLKVEILKLIEKWHPIMGVRPAQWGIKRMKTRWGSCNVLAQRIWLNAELIKYPIECLEYVFVHEMIHFFERYHNQRFYHYMTRFLPDWQSRKMRLNQFISQ